MLIPAADELVSSVRPNRPGGAQGYKTFGENCGPDLTTVFKHPATS